MKVQEGEEKLTLGSKEEKNTVQASAQKCGRQRVSTIDQRRRKNGMMCGEGLFIEPKEMGEEETLNQAINGHNLRATQRMPNVTDSRAASVH